MDEPWELGPERRGEWAQWLRSLRALPVLAGRELLVWGDVPAVHPELLGELPDGVTVCEWGYEGNHPFEQRTARLEDAGVPFWVCPGTSSWMSIAGRIDNMIENVSAAAIAGVAHGAEGLLVTDWGDFGHHQQPFVSDPGFATAAAFGWCGASHAGLDADDLATAAGRALLRRPGAQDGPGRDRPGRDLPHGGTAAPQHVGLGPAVLPSPVAHGKRGHRRPHRTPISRPCGRSWTTPWSHWGAPGPNEATARS